ncbi:UNVERIFIED_CONTAM: Mechanosensitive ion channel protein 10 [Sesamum angustifolium]|uniref:Mechanosensitive ion channel protein 10 n=1 Tax=Sesamum angustifolium TaxID=2727405 RepID=A0AAW2N7R3_9LAMI
MASVGGDDDDDDDDDDKVYETENVKLDKVKRGKKVKVMVMIEWTAFVCIMAVLIASSTVNKLKDFKIWSLELWKWSVLVLVFCGRLFTEWFTNALVFLIERNFLLKKKVLYFVFSLKKSVRVVIWLALILLAWALLINRGVKRSEETSRVLNYITRGFQESIFHQYILQALSGAPIVESDAASRISGQLSFNKLKTGKQEKSGEVINVDKLYKMKREKVSAWTMGGLIRVVRNSELPTISEVLDESVEEESEGPKVITSEVEARDAAKRIFRNVAKPGHKYIDEDDLLRFMPKEEVDNAIPLFEGLQSQDVLKNPFKNWVVKAYNERKCLAVSLNDAKTAIEELNKIASGLVLLVIVILWLLLMEITTTKVLVFISSQLLLVVFMFGNTAKMIFEAIIFVFVVHPFDVGDRCVVDGVQMVVDEMNILSTIFLKADNEKVCYPNAILATKPISNFNRSPEMGDAVEFAVDFNTSVEHRCFESQNKSNLGESTLCRNPCMKLDVLGTDSLAQLSAVNYGWDTSPEHWSPNHSVQMKEIVDVNKMIMALYVSHTINFQNAGERGNRRSDLVFELKKIFEEVGIKYRLLPQEVQINYVGEAMPVPNTIAR